MTRRREPATMREAAVDYVWNTSETFTAWAMILSGVAALAYLCCVFASLIVTALMVLGSPVTMLPGASLPPGAQAVPNDRYWISVTEVDVEFDPLGLLLLRVGHVPDSRGPADLPLY